MSGDFSPKSYRSILAGFALSIVCCGTIRAQDVLIPFDADWLFVRGTAEPSPDAIDGSATTDWTEPEFDDATWEAVPLGIGYSDGDDTTILTDMEDSYTTIYLRKTFNVTNPAAFDNLLLSVNYDDGFVCYLNGTEVLQANTGAAAGTVLPRTATAPGNHEQGTLEPFDLTADLGELVVGENVMAVQVLNAGISSSDLSFNAQLTANDPFFDCPTDLNCEVNAGSVVLSWTLPGTVDSINVMRDGDPLPGSPFAGTTATVTDNAPSHFYHQYEVIADAGGFQCATMTCTTQPLETVLIADDEEWRFFRGATAPSTPATAWRGSGFNDSGWEQGPTGIGYGDNDDATVLDDMQTVADDPVTPEDETVPGYLTYYCRKSFTVPNPAVVDVLLLDADYDDGFIAYLNGTEVARSANMGDVGEAFAFDDPAGAQHNAGTPEVFQLDASLLQAGANTLAVEVHNLGLTSSDASWIPRLYHRMASLPEECPTDLACELDTDAGEIRLSWTNGGTYDSITVERDGADLPGSPFPAGTTSVTDDDPGDFDHTYEVVATTDLFSCPPLTCTTLLPTVDLITVGEDWRFFRGVAAPSTPADAWRTTGFADAAWETGPTGIGYADGDDATVLNDMRMIADDPLTPEDESQPGYLSFYCRKTFNVGNLGDINDLILEIDFDDGFIAYLNGAEVARSTMGAVGQEFTFDQAAAGGHEADGNERFTLDESELVAGENLLAIELHNQNIDSSDASLIPRLLYTTLGPSTGTPFRRGDFDDDGTVNITDGISLLNWQFLGGQDTTCAETRDSNDDGFVNITDATFLFNFLFLGGQVLPQPGSSCGLDDPASPQAGCNAYTSCP